MSLNLTDIPAEVVSDVIGGYDNTLEIVQRRKLGPEWFRRYLVVVPSLVADNEIMTYALETKDEDLIIDILSVTNGDVDDVYNLPVGSHPSFNKTYGIRFLSILERFVSAQLSQKFGDRLATLPMFVSNLSIMLCKMVSTIEHNYLLNISERQALVSALHRSIDSLGYFDRIDRAVLRTFCSDPHLTFIILECCPDESSALKLIAWAQRCHLRISDDNIGSLMYTYENDHRPPSLEAVEILFQYPYVYHAQ
jgi:hypothetical protein